MTARTDITVEHQQARRLRRSDPVLVMVATVGTVAYAISFKVAEFDIRVQGIACAIGCAAAISWLGLGCVLAMMSRLGSRAVERTPPMGWFCTCLRTMAVGMAILSCGTVLNLVIYATSLTFDGLAAAHIGILIASDVVMGVVFVSRAKALGLPRLHAASLWVLVLNGVFAGALLLLWPRG